MRHFDGFIMGERQLLSAAGNFAEAGSFVFLSNKPVLLSNTSKANGIHKIVLFKHWGGESRWGTTSVLGWCVTPARVGPLCTRPVNRVSQSF